MADDDVALPRGFVWGAATSSYQIEGSAAADGRGPSVWDTFSHVPGRIRDGTTGDIACDHYRRMPADVGLMAELGLRAYRFSIAWPRVMPAGAGPVEPRGLAFYDRLVDELLEHGIEPWPTLFHWDLPQALEDRGGFRGRDCADRFADYAAVVVARLGDRVPRWATLNEPFCYAYLGHAAGVHAPGMRDPAAAVAVAHHQMLGHARAVRAMRAVRSGLELGIVLNPSPVRWAGPAGSAHDVVRRIDGTMNRWFLDAALAGRYPADVIADLGTWAAAIRDGDEAELGPPLDWLGVNYYNDHVLRPAAPGDLPALVHITAPGLTYVVAPAGRGTDIGWPITPGGFTDVLTRIHNDYPHAPAMVVTENGAAYDDPVIDGVCDDQRRIAYLDGHLRALAAAIEAGVDVRGYFVWSLFDNFEWAEGYAMRFGIVHVDFATQRRTPKASARWYGELARSGLLGPVASR